MGKDCYWSFYQPINTENPLPHARSIIQVPQKKLIWSFDLHMYIHRKNGSGKKKSPHFTEDFSDTLYQMRDDPRPVPRWQADIEACRK